MAESIPPTIAAFVQTLATEGRAPAYVRLDADQRLIDWGGSVSHYGLHDLIAGADAEREALADTERDTETLGDTETEVQLSLSADTCAADSAKL